MIKKNFNNKKIFNDKILWSISKFPFWEIIARDPPEMRHDNFYQKTELERGEHESEVRFWF